MMFPAHAKRGAAIIERDGDFVEYHTVDGVVFDMKAVLQVVSDYQDPNKAPGEVTQSPQLKVHPSLYPDVPVGFKPQERDWFVYDGEYWGVNAVYPSGLGIVRLLIQVARFQDDRAIW
jgi:hypothetical protein